MTPQRENLVLIHGLLGSLTYFEPNKYLSEVNVYTPSMHCYGGSNYLENLTLQDQANYIKSLILENINEPCWILGHSVGGAISNIFASQNPELVKGIINVEGNFTLNDAFWCQKISRMNINEWTSEYENISSNPEDWLRDVGIEITPERVKWAKDILSYQTAKAALTVACAVINDTNTPEYRDAVNKVIKSDIPMHLVAGEHSAKDWDVPANARKSAKDFHVIGNTGHMIMLEKPKEFCDLIIEIVMARV